MTPRTGRPPKDEPHDQPLTIKLTRAELIAAKTAAARTNTPLATWARHAINTATRQP